MSDGVTSMRGSVKSADRQRWSCKSSLTLWRARSDRRGAPLHPLDFQLGSASALPFSASLCFGGAWKKIVKARILLFFFPPKQDRQGSREGSLNIYQVQHVTQGSLRHLEPQDLVPPTVQTSSFTSNGAVRRDKHFFGKLTLFRWSRKTVNMATAEQKVPPTTAKHRTKRSCVRGRRVPQSLETDGLQTRNQTVNTKALIYQLHEYSV